MTTSFESIPKIDLSLANNPDTLPQLLADLHHALVDVGFLYVSNHGVPSSVISDLVSALPKLFSLNEAAKRAVALENSPHFLGYSGVGTENTGGAADLREQFEFATELTATWREGLPLYERLRGPNQWPNSDAKLRNVIESYISELSQLGERFLDLVARALSLPSGTFKPFLSDQHRLKLVHYPESSSSPPGQGVGPHKDSSGWWTFLLQASPPEVKGLQVLNKSGSWIDVPVEPGTFVVNIGQAFEVVTGGVCKATTHRVLSGQRERFSVPFFQGVRRDLTKAEAVGALQSHFAGMIGDESSEGSQIDSAFLRGKYDTWGESQLRTKVRSHRENGKKYYSEVYEKYINDDLA
ncbi:2OG-Fe(II) oxygenase superfamily protein [Xylaria bambusicola]|uniref:2OG-Fe(II) oxygenase superfamily protein n=1 Tax=Xylaria bambusicola TaxID=326684 RepID=UPI002008B525|nr:2OG-Fe(II) oxygenase superfamily protein [Xylaria bambusicola]KAI0521384.1 2OG-Fe(II) oxygenase superfamily protein [Xylaria bambusicola]